MPAAGRRRSLGLRRKRPTGNSIGSSRTLTEGKENGIAVVYLIAWTVVALPVGTFVLLSDRKSRYPFTTQELSRFEKYRRIIHTTVHP
jgi:hypothetical protein